MLKRWIYEEDGQTLVEYGLLLALVALVVVAAVGLFGRSVFKSFDNSNNQLPF